MNRPTLGLAFSLIAASFSAAMAGPPCTGDCNGSGDVTVDEILVGVNIALGSTAVGACLGFDGNGDAVVTVDEIVGAVNSALAGCPSYVGNYAGTSGLDGTQNATIAFGVAGTGQLSGTVDINPTARTRAAGSSAGITGSVDLAAGTFSASGSYVAPGGQTVPVSLSGTLPGPGRTASVTLQIGPNVYTATLSPTTTAPPTPTPTPVSGTARHITVGRSDTPFFPEFIEIELGDTIVWDWVGGPHSVVSGPTAAPGTIDCSSNGLFTSPVQSSGSFAHTFNTSGEFWYHCGVAGHCENFESALIVVRAGTPTPTRTATPTFPPTPTATPTPDTVGGITREMVGTFSGTAYFELFGTQQPARFRIDVFGDAIQVTDLTGFIFGTIPYSMKADSTTRISYHLENGSTTDIYFELKPGGVLNGRMTVVVPAMPSTPIRFELTKE